MITIRTNKIEAIKALRQFCLDTFGVPCGLMAAKDFVDLLNPDQIGKDAEGITKAWKAAGGSVRGLLDVVNVAYNREENS